nr:DNA-deoxyinosine glycosylase [Novosphingobium sp. SG720]
MIDFRKSAFAPVVNAQTRVLVCGSLPGEASLAAQRYYAHPANQFWRLIGGVIGQDLVPLDYPARLDALLRAGIGLWDTVASATRAGSLDTAIRAAQLAPLAQLAARLPALRAIGFNGATAARHGRAQMADLPDISFIQLPSSSPAYCAVTLAQKQQAWSCLQTFLD